MSFIGVYKALYAYTPQSNEELSIDENDILYLLEKSDVDDWWTVKKRVVGPDADEPVGLVPSNYIEPADYIGSATALYDYDRQTEEEVSFKEGDQFQVYDDKDPDWILVTKGNQEFGFVPSNYIELNLGGSSTAPTAAAVPASSIPPPPSHPAQSIPSFQPPPQRQDRIETPPKDIEPESRYAPVPISNQHSRDKSNDYDDEQDYDEAPPPKPTRPTQSQRPSSSSQPTRSQPEDEEDDQLYTWSVSEVEGRKKKKAMLAIGNSTIYFSPDSVHGGTPHQWKSKDLLSFSSEKKHLFLEFRNPLYSLEIHSGTKEVAAEILSVLGELKGAESDKGLREVAAAASSKPKSSSLPSSKKTGKILYDFEAQGDDELSVVEGDNVYILNDKKSKDWWMVQLVNSGQSGVVPAQFVQSTSESGLSSLTSKFKRSKSKDNITNPSPSKKEQKRLQGPKASRVRTWEDSSGTFKVEAEFLGVVEGKIHLHKTNGVKIAVAAPKLSITDLEYVEKVTGMSLEQYKTSKKGASSSSSDPDRERKERRERERRRRERDERERDRQERERDRRERELEREERDRLRRELRDAKTGEAVESPPPQPARPGSSSAPSKSSRAPSAPKDEYDWFEFFLEAGVDVNQCQRYTNNFNKEQIDPSIIESIDSSILRTLGLREGDIIRVMKYLDQKFDRQPKTQDSNSQGGLFTEPTGALKTNRTGSAGGVTNTLPSPTKTTPSNVDDDAWTVKPAATNTAVDRPPSVLTQNFTGSMQDLVNLKPLAPTATASSTKSVPTYAPVPSKPLQPTKSGATTNTSNINIQKTGDFIPSQPTGATLAPLDPFKTGGANILPLTTGGAFVYLPIQQTGALQLQPTGLVPIQQTGLLPLQKTGGNTGGLMPLQKTGGGLPFQQTGLLPLQKTGPLGGLPQTGINPTGSLPPTTSFGQAPTFNQPPPTTSFGSQPTGGFIPQSQFGLQQTGLGGLQTGQPTGGFNGTSFNNFQPTGGFQQQPQPTSFNQQPTFSQQPTGFNGQSPFGGQTTGFNGQTPFSGQPTGFNSISSPPTFNNPQQTFGQQPQFNQQMNQLTNSFQNASIQSPSPFQQQQPTTSFYQNPQQTQSFGGFQPQQQQQPFYQNNAQSFGGFQPQAQPLQPLESQPTGFGFGNSAPNTSFGQQPLGAQMTGASKRANLANATADNPFGF